MKLERNGYETAVSDVNEAAAYLCLSRQAVYTPIRAGTLAHVRVGDVISLRLVDLEAYLEANATRDWKKGGRAGGRQRPAGPEKRTGTLHGKDKR